MSNLVKQLFIPLNHDITSCVLHHWFTFMPPKIFVYFFNTVFTDNTYFTFAWLINLHFGLFWKLSLCRVTTGAGKAVKMVILRN